MITPKKILIGTLVLYIVVLALIAFEELETPWNGHKPLLGLTGQTWPAVWTVSAAAIGWMVTGLVSIQNSIKQHTINTLLQSRLSATYQEKIKTMDKKYPPSNDGRTPVALGDWENVDNKDSLEAYRYLLNYYEFLAVGIAAGDLHGGLLRRSLRGVICVNVRAAWQYVAYMRLPDERIYEHLLALYKVWNRPTRWEQLKRFFKLSSAVRVERAKKLADDRAAEKAEIDEVLRRYGR